VHVLHRGGTDPAAADKRDLAVMITQERGRRD